MYVLSDRLVCHGDDANHRQAMDDLMSPEPAIQILRQVDLDSEGDPNWTKITPWPVSAGSGSYPTYDVGRPRRDGLSLSSWSARSSKPSAYRSNWSVTVGGSPTGRVT